jgi:ribosomal protein L37AE/L43A
MDTRGRRLSKFGQAYVALSFFKHSKIDYMYDANNSIILFPCFCCGTKTSMDTGTTVWHCQTCKEKGNILTLHKMFKENTGTIQKKRIYNPKREKEEIYRKLERSAKKYQDSSFLELIDKIDLLFDHYKINKKGV